MEPLISIIIPVYNCENYLRNAVTSVINQSYKNMEIILIDDCSKDRSYIVAQELKANDNRIVILKTQSNSGASVARNLGLNYCHGDYIAFVDSDDYAHPEFLSQLYKSLSENDADISMCGFYKTFKPSVNTYSPLTNASGFTRTGKECALHLVDSSDSILYNVLWNKLYKKDLWNEIRFPAGMASEDFHVCYKVYSMARRVSYVRERLYYYYQNTKSVMHTCSNISKYNDKTLDEYQTFIMDTYDDATINKLNIDIRKYRTDSVVEDYYVAYKTKNKSRMKECILVFSELYGRMKDCNDPLPLKFRIFEFNKTLYKLGRSLLEFRDYIKIVTGVDSQGKI